MSHRYRSELTYVKTNVHDTECLVMHVGIDTSVFCSMTAIFHSRTRIAVMEQNTEVSPQTPVGVRQGNFTKLRAPNIHNLRADAFERGTHSIYYADFLARHVFLQVPTQAFAAKYIECFKDGLLGNHYTGVALRPPH